MNTKQTQPPGSLKRLVRLLGESDRITAEWRKKHEGEIIEALDEYLDPRTAEWTPVTPAAIGQRYNPRDFHPIRRRTS